MAYANYAPVTIDNTQVSGTANLTNFPVLVSGTFDGTGGEADIRTTGNGGNVQNTDATGGASGGLTVPADLAFYDDTSRTTQYDHEVIAYNASTGVLKAWVRIPSVSYNSDTTFYMHYNDSAVTTSQENIGGVWETNYKGVWHLQESSGTRYDSSGNSNSLTDNNTVTGLTGKIHNGSDFELTNSETLSITDAAQTGLDITGDMTWSVWMKFEQLPSTAGSAFGFFAKWLASTNYSWLFQSENGGPAADKMRCYYSADGSTLTNILSDSVIVVSGDVGNWVHYAVTLDVSSQTMVVYKNSSSIASTLQSGSGTAIYNGTAAMEIGGPNFYDGGMEHFKVYSGLLTSDWITTEYNNQNAPGTFLTVGTEVSAGGISPSRRMIVMS